MTPTTGNLKPPTKKTLLRPLGLRTSQPSVSRVPGFHNKDQFSFSLTNFHMNVLTATISVPSNVKHLLEKRKQYYKNRLSECLADHPRGLSATATRSSRVLETWKGPIECARRRPSCDHASGTTEINPVGRSQVWIPATTRGFFRHEILLMKVPNVKFDLNVSDFMMQDVTDTSKISMRAYNSMQMSNSSYYLDVLFAWLQ